MKYTALALLMALLSEPARAHSMYQSAVLIDFKGDTVQAELQLPVDRLSIAFRQTVDPTHFTALGSYVMSHVHPVDANGKPMPVTLESMQIQTIENAPYLVVRLRIAPAQNGNVDSFTLNYDVITHEIVTHAVLVSIRSDSKAGIPLADPLLIGMLRASAKSIQIDRAAIL